MEAGLGIDELRRDAHLSACLRTLPSSTMRTSASDRLASRRDSS